MKHKNFAIALALCNQTQFPDVDKQMHENQFKILLKITVLEGVSPEGGLVALYWMKGPFSIVRKKTINKKLNKRGPYSLAIYYLTVYFLNI
jgi:hypothetical protein